MPYQARGYKSQIVLDFEKDFGVEPDTKAGVVMPFNSCTLQSKQNLTEDMMIRNNRNPAMPIGGNIDVSGSIVTSVDAVGFGYWLKAICGAPDTKPVSTDPSNKYFIHTFKPKDLQPSLVIDKQFTDTTDCFKYNGVKINSMQINVGGDGELTATFEVMGGKETVSKTPYDVNATKYNINKFGQFMATLQEGGQKVANIIKIDMSLNCNLDGSQYLVGGGGFRGDIPESIIQPTGTVTAIFSDMTLLNKAMGNQKSSIRLVFENTPFKLEIYYPEIKYERNTPGIEGPQGVQVSLPFRSFYDANTDLTSIMFVLTNDKTKY